MIIEELVTRLGVEVDSEDLTGFGTQLAGAASAMAALATAGAAVVGVIGEVLETAGQDAELKLFASGIRDNYEAIQALETIIGQFAVSSGQLRGTLSGLRQAIDGALSGLDTGNIEAFASLGLSSDLRDEAGNPIRPSDLLKRIADVVQGAGDSPLINARLEAIGIGPDLIPLLRNGSAGLAAMTAEMRELGALRTGEQAEAALEYAQNLDKVKQSLEGLVFEVGEPAVQWATDLLEGFLEWRKSEEAAQLIDRMSDSFAAFGELGKAVGGVLGAIGDLFGVVTPLIRNALGPLEPFVARWLEWVASFGPLRTILGGVESLVTSIADVMRGEGFGADLLGNIGLSPTSISDVLNAGSRAYGGALGGALDFVGLGGATVNFEQKNEIHVQGNGRDVVSAVRESRDDGLRETVNRLSNRGGR
jgi:hypothetical protein